MSCIINAIKLVSSDDELYKGCAPCVQSTVTNSYYMLITAQHETPSFSHLPPQLHCFLCGEQSLTLPDASSPRGSHTR